jgi:hypothetical protein
LGLPGSAAPELRRGGALWIAGLLTPFARATARDRTKRGGADAQANRREWAACRSSSEAVVNNPSRGARQRVEAHLVTLIPGFRPATTASQESGLTPGNLPLSKRAKVAVERCGFFLRQSLRRYLGIRNEIGALRFFLGHGTNAYTPKLIRCEGLLRSLRGLWSLNGYKTSLMALGSHKASFAVIECICGPIGGMPFATLGLRVGRATIASRSMCKVWQRAFRSMRQRQDAGSIQTNEQNGGDPRFDFRSTGSARDCSHSRARSAPGMKPRGLCPGY